MTDGMHRGDPRLAVLALEPLSAAALEDRLDYLLGPVLSSRRTATPLAEQLAPLERAQQDFVLRWVEVASRTNHELAYQLAAAAPLALRALDFPSAEAWIIDAMDCYDRDGLHGGSAVFRQFGQYARAPGGATTGVTFEEAAPVLALFVCGLAGRRMTLDTAAHPYTDTETLYLPLRIAGGATRSENFLIFKVLAALLWAQCRYGTFSVDLGAACARYGDPARALDVLNALETLRIEARLASDLPGLAREIARLRGAAVPDPRCHGLSRRDATVQDSIALLESVYDDFRLDAQPYRTVLMPDAAAGARLARLAREKSALQQALASMLDELRAAPQPREAAQVRRFAAEVSATPGTDGAPSVRLALDGAPVTPTPEVARLLDSILQDLGEIPDEYLVTAGDGGDREAEDAGRGSAIDRKGGAHDSRAHLYDEWDYQRRHYRKNWCVLREFDVPPADPEFVSATLEKYAPQVAQLKRTFELLRGEDRLLRREPRGDDIDLDAVVSAYADMKSGCELAERLFTRRLRTERNLAVMFMVDMSGSTKGWINDAEREALVMLCEALEILGDRYAIYGFSGITRKRCEMFRVKRFDEPYTDAVRCRIAGVQPQDYTRMGVAIRHLSALLGSVDARTKLLITLSDGKPDDYSDNYRGEYGIEDTRQALLEAHRSGIKPFCVTIDHEARDYLPHLYGPVSWTLVDDVSKLPLKVADIYRRLTT